jgi:hypothetical protein
MRWGGYERLSRHTKISVTLNWVTMRPAAGWFGFMRKCLSLRGLDAAMIRRLPYQRNPLARRVFMGSPMAIEQGTPSGGPVCRGYVAAAISGGVEVQFHRDAGNIARL